MRQGAHGWYDRDRKKDRERKRRLREELPRCSVQGCETRLSARGFWISSSFGKPLRVCHRHKLLYMEHERIMNRIRAIPQRDAI